MKILEYVKTPFEYIKMLAKWLVVASVVGIVGGFVGSVFHLSIDYVTEFRVENSWLIYLLPIGGLVIALLYGFARKAGKIDTNRVIEAVKSDATVPFVMAPLIFISTVITHLLGGSAGREGAALQLGGSLGFAVGRVFRLDKGDKHIIVMAGMSAVFAALFGTPVTAMFFALEVTSVGVMYYAGLVPCAISALVASRLAATFGLAPVRFLDIDMPDVISIALTAKVVALAVVCALVSILFCFAIKKCEHYGKKWMPGSYVRGFAGGIVIVLLTLIAGTTDYNGAGMDVIGRAMNGDAGYEAFLLKIIFTAVTVAAGFRGGEIVPTFFIGSTLGCIAAQLLGIDAGFGAAIGFVALFCGVVNCPVASFMLAMEVFGGKAMLLFAVVCAVSYVMSGYSSLYKSQRIMYSKLRDEYVNADTK